MIRPDRKVDVFPKILPVGREVTITMSVISAPELFVPGAEYTVTCYEAEGSGMCERPAPRAISGLRVQPGKLSFKFKCDSEQEYTFEIHSVTKDGPQYLMTSRVYALRDDLFALRPFKGDTHMHSRRSDGRECPAYVAAAGRKSGLDFLAITDHGMYAPSLEAMKAYDGLNMALSMCPGEEVHLEGTRVHIINFGASRSVQALADRNRKKFRAEVAAIAKKLTDIKQPELRKEYAVCVWAYDRIRKAGGLGVFCHPHWFAAHAYNVQPQMIALHFERTPFDAFEYIGGCGEETNILEAACYHEAGGRQKKLSVVGASDTHHTADNPNFGAEYTLAFARSKSTGDLVSAMRKGMSVAVENFPDRFPRAHGEFRLVKYAQYLFREFFPRHDDLCEQDGYWMIAHLAGDKSAAGHLASLKVAGDVLYRKCWG